MSAHLEQDVLVMHEVRLYGVTLRVVTDRGVSLPREPELMSAPVAVLHRVILESETVRVMFYKAFVALSVPARQNVTKRV